MYACFKHGLSLVVSASYHARESLMNVLLLSCNTGGGHNAAARAIAQRLTELGVSCTTRDAMKYGLPGESRFICFWHNLIYLEMPRLFGLGYHTLELYRQKTKPSVLYRYNKRKAKKLYRSIEKEGYDAVICTHLFPAIAMTALRKTYHTTCKAYYVVTDYTCYPGMSDVQMDGYFIPHADIAWEFMAAGIPSHAIYATGLPIAQKFDTPHTKAEARAALNLSQESKVLLVMGGSTGCGPVAEFVSRMASHTLGWVEMVVICGTNQKLKQRVEAMHLPRVRVVGYCDHVHLYMDAANLIVTKAGGISSTEAARKGLPIVYMDAVPGCETKNLAFFCQKGYAVTAFQVPTLARMVKQLLEDEDTLAKMSARQKKDFTHNGAHEICAIVTAEHLTSEREDTLSE